MIWTGHVAGMEERRGVYRVYSGETRGKATTLKTQAYMRG